MAWIKKLLAYAKQHPEPRLFHPIPESANERSRAEAKALAAQELIVTTAEDLVR
jgi:hypothetical protein